MSYFLASKTRNLYKERKKAVSLKPKAVFINKKNQASLLSSAVRSIPIRESFACFSSPPFVIN
jgi:hypothetical protein